MWNTVFNSGDQHIERSGGFRLSFEVPHRNQIDYVSVHRRMCLNLIEKCPYVCSVMMVDTVTMVRGVDNYRVSPTDSHRQQHEQPIMTDRLYLCSSLERRMRHFCTDSRSCNFHQRNMWRSLATLSRTRNDFEFEKILPLTVSVTA